MSENLSEQSDEKWENWKKEGFKNREQFLEIFPQMEEWLIESEKMHGAFIGTTSISFLDGRIVFVTRFENAYHTDFYNPNLDQSIQDRSIALSPEMTCAWNIALEILRSKEDFPRLVELLGNKKNG